MKPSRRSPRPRIVTELRAKLLGTYKGQRVFRWPVIIHQSWLGQCADVHEDEVVVEVSSPSAADAAALVWEEVATKINRPTQVTVVGPAGGVAAHRFIGWESMIGAELFRCRPTCQQLVLI